MKDKRKSTHAEKKRSFNRCGILLIRQYDRSIWSVRTKKRKKKSTIVFLYHHFSDADNFRNTVKRARVFRSVDSREERVISDGIEQTQRSRRFAAFPLDRAGTRESLSGAAPDVLSPFRSTDHEETRSPANLEHGDKAFSRC